MAFPTGRAELLQLLKHRELSLELSLAQGCKRLVAKPTLCDPKHLRLLSVHCRSNSKLSPLAGTPLALQNNLGQLAHHLINCSQTRDS